MADTRTVIEQAYSAFNKRNIDGALALMTEDVSWHKASEGGKVVGKEDVRSRAFEDRLFHTSKSGLCGPPRQEMKVASGMPITRSQPMTCN